jgi:hypothetical protein
MPAKKSTAKSKTAAPKKKAVKKTSTKKAPAKKVAKASSKKTVAKKTVQVTSKKVAPKKPVAKKVSKPVEKTAAAKTMPAVKAPASNFLAKVETKKLLWPLVALLVIVLLYMFRGELIVARVNGKSISRFALIRNLEKQGASSVLEDMTLRILIEQKIKEAGVEVEQSEIDAEIQNVSDMLEAQGQSLADLLEAQGMTMKEVEDQLRLSKGMEALLADRVEVTDEEVEAYFEDNKDLLGVDADLESMRDQIKEQLRQSKLSSEQQIWLEEIKSESNIKYFKFAPASTLAL